MLFVISNLWDHTLILQMYPPVSTIFHPVVSASIDDSCLNHLLIWVVANWRFPRSIILIVFMLVVSCKDRVPLLQLEKIRINVDSQVFVFAVLYSMLPLSMSCHVVPSHFSRISLGPYGL